MSGRPYYDKPARAKDVLDWFKRVNPTGYVYLRIPEQDQTNSDEETLIPVSFGQREGDNMILYVDSRRIQLRPHRAITRNPVQTHQETQVWSLYWLRKHLNYLNHLHWKRTNAGCPPEEHDMLEGLANMFGALYDAALKQHNILITWDRTEEKEPNAQQDPAAEHGAA